MKDKLEGRVRYYKGKIHDNDPHEEYYIFENKWASEDEWGLELAVPIVNDMVHYTALTQIRQWQRLGITFHFA